MATLPRGSWQQPGSHNQRYGNIFNESKNFRAWDTSKAFDEAIKSTATAEQDIFEFGVYTGGHMHIMARRVPTWRHMWGFDSFQGLPPEQPGLQVEGKHWSRGAFSASDAMGVWDQNKLLKKLRHKIGRTLACIESAIQAILPASLLLLLSYDLTHVVADPNVTLVPGFFNESLPRLNVADFRPALVVEIDSDLYVSAKDALTWLFRSKLMQPGTLVRYDDWPYVPEGTPMWGEMKAHFEVTEQFRVKWRRQATEPKGSDWRANEFQILSIGGARDGRLHRGRRGSNGE